MKINSPTYVDLFAGCGGFSLGLHWAGFNRVCALEKSQDAARTYYHNLICREKDEIWPSLVSSDELQISTGLVIGDIEIRLDDMVRSCKMRGSQIDLVAGGPPCQGYSTAGKRNPDDPRNKLADYMVEAVRILHPKVLLIENVPAIDVPFNVKDENGSNEENEVSKLSNIIKDLETLNYITSVIQLKASSFGVPQQRERLFLVGIREDLLKDLPKEFSSMEIFKDMQSFLNKTVCKTQTAGDALADINNFGYKFDKKSEYDNLSYAMSLRFNPELATPAAIIAGEKIGYENLTNHELRKHKANTIERFNFYLKLKRFGAKEWITHEAAQSDIISITRRIRGQLIRNGHSLRYLDSLAQQLGQEAMKYKTLKHTQLTLDIGLPARTITTLPDDLIHYSEPRILSVRELARLQSFPDSFVFKGNPTTGGKRRKYQTPQYTQVGNAVPPLLAKTIGIEIKKLLSKIDLAYCNGVSGVPVD